MKEHNVKIILKDGTIFRITYKGFINDFFKMREIVKLDPKIIVSATHDGKPFDFKKVSNVKE